ncbi:MAG: NAD(P)-dependent oxidoreductase, partial [Rhodospirillales bacterium]|nr:NAD(P)-dependent oxidoreductase [Rhodospirillales bacterium]
EGPAALAAACERCGAALISYSTDYVFNGRNREPYVESEEISPLSVYGRTKALGEERIRETLERHLILRTSWVFSAGRPNFVNTILRLASERESLSIVADEIGCPTHAGDIAATTLRLIDLFAKEGDFPWGTYHYCGAGPVSRYQFAEAILRESAMFAELVAIDSDEFVSAAARPLRAVLDCGRIERFFGIRQPDWRQPLARVIQSFHGKRVGWR